jgi:hypothetical protein
MVKAPADQPLDIYMDWGRYDLRSPQESWDVKDLNKNFVKLLKEKGYEPSGGEAPHGTGWSSWGNHTGALFEALFPLEKASR